MSRLFDLFVMADWSAAATPGPPRPSRDRCWVGWAERAGPVEACYCRTRGEAEARIAALLGACRGNALVGFDFPFGYPAGSGLGGGRALAAKLAGLVEDRADGANNRFAVAAALNAALNDGMPGPFWGCPPAAAGPTLTATKHARRGRAFPDHRECDGRLVARGIQSCWKLYTTGSVGSQVLVGMPAVHRLVSHPGFGARCRIWPFETGWDARLDGIVVAEIWPSLFDHAAVDHPIRDARQVIAACRWLRDTDSHGRLRAALARPAGLDARAAAQCLAGEGWILGLGGGLA